MVCIMSGRARVVIRKRLTVATALGAAFLMLGCGKTRDVSEGAPSAAAGDSATAEGGATAEDAGGATSAGGGPDGATGGAQGNGSSGQAGHAWGGAPTWDPEQCHAAPIPEPADRAAAEQWSVARKYCAALGKQGCLETAAFSVAGCSADEGVEACVAQVLWFHANSVSSECESAWRTDLECGANSNLALPACGGVDTFGLYGPSNTCAQENAALSDCVQQHSTDVEVTGSYTTCHYSSASVSGSGCDVTCQLGPNSAELVCSGPEGLPKQCGCKINGHVLLSANPIFVSDCADAAGQAADGLCTGKLDCCFAYTDQGKPTCRCEEPAEFGYDSCAAMMAVAKGQRVDICPGLLPDDMGGECWPPGSCSP
jgi:hypothetical protein